MQVATIPTTKLTIFLAIILLLSTVSFIAANAVITLTNTIYQGVMVADIDVGGLSEEQAKQKLLTVYRARTAEPMRLMYAGKTWTVSATDIDLTIDADKLAREAYQVGRNGHIVAQLNERYLTVNRGYSVPLAISYSTEKLNQLLMDISQTIDTNPKDATLILKGSDLVLIPDEIGRKLNIVKTIADITTGISTQVIFSVNLRVDEILPQIRTTDLQEIDRVLASYTTQFDLADTNRSENIYLAAKSINNTLVRRGESFSFNRVVGPRLSDRGYKKAPGYIDGVLVPDWGGGVCQVSSTIYNAALLADMTIVERTSHIRPPAYLPLGQDATVADNLLDFIFRNPSSGNIYLKTEAVGNQLTVTILGKHNESIPEIQIVATDTKIIEPNTIVKQDATLELGKQVVEVEGQKGFLVTTYRIKKINGKETSRELLSTDEFKPVDTVLRVGTKAPSKASK
jgi:vancomycin resistance protein YoaR